MLTDEEREMLDAANRRVEALHQEVERSNSATIRSRDTNVSSVIVVLITPPTSEQLQNLASAAEAELEQFKGNRRVESAANKSFHSISKSFTEFRDSKYKILIPIIHQDGDRAPGFLRGFSDSEALANPFERTPPDTAQDYLSKAAELPMKEAETTSNWRGEDPLYLRYNYLFEIEESE